MCFKYELKQNKQILSFIVLINESNIEYQLLKMFVIIIKMSAH